MGAQACKIDELTSTSILNSEGMPIFDPIETAVYMETANYFMGKVFREHLVKEGLTISDLVSTKTNVNITYQNMMNSITAFKNDTTNNLSPKARADLGKIIDDWRLFKKYHQESNNLVNVRQVSTDDEDLEVEDETEETPREDPSELVNTAESQFAPPGNKDSTFELMSNELRSAFRMLPAASTTMVNGKLVIEEMFDQNGLPMVANFDSIFNLLSQKLAGYNDMKEFKNVLTSPELLKIIPEVKFLNEMLGITSTSRSLNQLMLFASFFKAFSRPMIQIWSSKLFMEDRQITYMYYWSAKGNRIKLEKMFSNNFKSGYIDDELLKRYTIVDNSERGSGRIRLVKLPPQPTQVDSKFITQTSTQSLEFLQLVGFRFSGMELLETDAERSYVANAINTAVTQLYGNLKERLDTGLAIYNPFKDLKQEAYNVDNIMIRSAKKALDNLVDLEGAYSKIAPTLTSKNTKGENQNEQSLHNGISVAIYYLNKARYIDNKEFPEESLLNFPPFLNLKYNPMLYNSYYINMLFNLETGEREMHLDNLGKSVPFYTVSLRNYNGLTIRDKDFMTKDLSKRDKFAADFLNLLSGSITGTMQLEAKDSNYAIALSNKDGYLVLPHSQDDFINGFEGTFMDRMVSYLKAELARIASYPKKKAENPLLPEDYEHFSILSEVMILMKPEDIANLKKATNLVYYERTSEELLPFIEAVNKYFSSRTDAVVKYADDNNIRLDRMITNKMQEAFGEKTTDRFGKQVGETKSVNIERLLRMLVANTFTLNVEFSTFVFTDPLFRAEKNDYAKRLGMGASTGNLTATYADMEEYLQGDDEYRWNEQYSPSKAMGYELWYNTESYDKDYRTAVLKELRQPSNSYATGRLREGFIASMRIKGIDLTEEKAIEMLKEQDALTTALADGQAYITLDGYRELAIRHQFYTRELEIVLAYEGLLFRQQENNITSTELDQLAEYHDIIMKDPNKYAAPPLKFTTLAPIKNATVDIKAGDKFSIKPLLPSWTAYHPQLSNLHKAMIKRQIMYVKFESGTKLSVRHIFENIEELAKDKKEGGVDPDLLPLEPLKEQLRTKVEQKTKSIIPTQFIKLLFGNLFDKGEALSPQIKDLRNQFIQFLSEIRDQQVNNLFSKMGFTRDSKGDIIDFNTENIIKKIRQEVTRQEMNSSVLESLKTIDGKFVSTFEEGGAMNPVLDYVIGIADKFLRRYKTNQADFVLISNAYENEDAPIKYLGWNPDGDTHMMECRITLTKEFSKLLNLKDPADDRKKIGTIHRLNQLLKNKEFVEANKKSLTVVFSRVPIQGPASMGTAIVKEFFFPTAGNVLQLPIEFMHQAGIDFDYDKEKVMLPNLSQDGIYVPHNLEDVYNDMHTLVRERDRVVRQVKDWKPTKNKTIRELRQKMKVFGDALFRNRTNLVDITDSSKEEKAADRDKEQIQKNIEDLHKLFNEGYDLEMEKDRLVHVQEMLTRDPLFDEEQSIEDSEMMKTFAENEAEFSRMITELNELGTEFMDVVRKIKGREYYRIVNIGLKYGERILALHHLTYMSKESTINKFVSLCSNTLSLRELFSEVVLPNSSNIIKDLAQQNAEDLKIEAIIPTKGKAMDYMENLRVFDMFYAAKALLAGNAIANVMHQMITQQGTKMNKEYNIHETVDSRQSTKIHLWMLPQDIADDITSENKEGIEQVSLASNTDARGRLIQHILSQVITATVDAAKNPFYSNLQQTWNNIYATIFMLHLRIPLENIVQLINNPLVLRYDLLIGQGLSKLGAMKKTLQYYGIIVDRAAKTMLKKMDDREQLSQGWSLGMHYLTPLDFDNLRRLKKSKNVIPVVGNNITQDTFDSLRVFAHFIMMTDHASEFRNFTSLFNNDTTKVGSRLQTYSKEMTRANIKESGTFDEDQIKSFEDNSIITPFRNDGVIEKILDYLFPLLDRKDILEASYIINQAYVSGASTSTSGRRTLPKGIRNDLIHAILGTFGIYEGENFTDYGMRLIGKYPGNPTLNERLASFKKTQYYKELSKHYTVLDKFHGEPQDYFLTGEPKRRTIPNLIYTVERRDPNTGELSRIPVDPQPILFISERTDSVVEEESYIRQLEELSTKDFGKFTKLIHDLVKDIFIAGMTQSGISDSGIGYYKYIPTSFKRALLTQSQRAFMAKNSSDADIVEFLNKFIDAFKQHNPLYFKSVLSLQTIDTPQLGKYYKLLDVGTPTAISFEPPTLRPSPTEAEDIDAIVQAEIDVEKRRTDEIDLLEREADDGDLLDVLVDSEVFYNSDVLDVIGNYLSMYEEHLKDASTLQGLIDEKQTEAALNLSEEIDEDLREDDLFQRFTTHESSAKEIKSTLSYLVGNLKEYKSILEASRKKAVETAAREQRISRETDRREREDTLRRIEELKKQQELEEQAGGLFLGDKIIALEVVADLVFQGKAVTTIRNASYHTQFYKGDGVYTVKGSDKQVNIRYGGIAQVKGGVVKIKLVDGSDAEMSLDDFGKNEGFDNWEGFKKGQKHSAKFITGEESRRIYAISPVVKETEESDESPFYEDDESPKSPIDNANNKSVYDSMHELGILEDYDSPVEAIQAYIDDFTQKLKDINRVSELVKQGSLKEAQKLQSQIIKDLEDDELYQQYYEKDTHSSSTETKDTLNYLLDNLKEYQKLLSVEQKHPKIIVTTLNYTKETPNDKTQGLFFTENLQAYLALRSRGREANLPIVAKGMALNVTSDNNQAGIRTNKEGKKNENAFAIISKKYQQNESGAFVKAEGQFQDTEGDFTLFKKYNTEAINEAIKSGLPLTISAGGIATGRSALPQRFAKWLLSHLENRLGITGDIVKNTTPGYEGFGISKIRPSKAVEAPQPVQGKVTDTGQYVTYQEETYIVTKVNANGTVQIYNPTKEGKQAKKSVAQKNLSLVQGKAKIVEHKGKEYIVTPKNTIISLTTNKKMDWGEENGDRKNILGRAKAVTETNWNAMSSDIKDKLMHEPWGFSEDDWNQLTADEREHFINECLK